MNPKRILIVEDDGIVGRDLQDTLVREGFSVPHVSASGERALELVEETRPDLILMDIALEGALDGIETAERIRASHRIPIVYLTGTADEEVEKRARATYPFGYVVKPFAENELIDIVKKAFVRHESIHQMEAGERMFASTLNSIAEGVITTDLAGNITLLNPIAEGITGWSSAEACGRPLEEVFRIYDPEGRAADPVPLGSLAGSGRAILLTARNGEQVAIEDNSAPIKDEQGSLTGLVVVFRRRRAETAAGAAESGDAESEGGDHLVRMVESIVDPMFTLDADWRISYVNPQAAVYFGSQREEIMGRVFWDDFPRRVRDHYQPQFQKAVTDASVQTFEFYHEAKNSWFEVTAYPFADGLLVLFKDISAKKQIQEERGRIDKLEGLGYLARGFAHDFNNLLTVLMGNLSLAASRVPPDADYRDEILAAKDASVQAQNLVQQLLTFAKGGAPIKKKLNPGMVVEEVMAECQASRTDKRVNYFYNLAPDLWSVRADRSQLKRLLQNLIRNSEQALREGGDVMVHCKNLDVESALPDEALHLDEDTSYVLIKIIDNGEGIPDSIRHQIFEPYFSGRKQANASGLGLTVCESIAKAHGGFTIIDSKEGKGTTASLYLPASRSSPVEEKESEPGPSGQRAGRGDADDADGLPGHEGREDEKAGAGEKPGNGDAEGGEPVRRRILILEDELLIRELISRNLTEAGYEVHQSAEGASTVAAYREAVKEGRKFDLVLMDLSIPEGMGGAEAMSQLRRIDRDVVAIVSSGYSDDPVMANHEQYGFSGVLPKPYEPQELRRLVADVLAAKRG